MTLADTDNRSGKDSGKDWSAEVLLTIRVDQEDLGEEYRSETVTPARLTVKNGKVFLTYQETDGEGGIIRSLIRAGQNQMEIIRHGAAESRMLLAAGRQTAEMRATPVGPMRIETYTREYSMRFTRDVLRIDASYDLYLDGEFISLCRARIETALAQTQDRR